MVTVRKSLLERGVGHGLPVARTAVRRQVTHPATGLTSAGRRIRLPGRRSQTRPMEEVLDRCWAKRRSASPRTGGGQANCWEEVPPPVLLMVGAEGPNKGLRLSVLDSHGSESRANREAVPTPAGVR